MSCYWNWLIYYDLIAMKGEDMSRKHQRGKSQKIVEHNELWSRSSCSLLMACIHHLPKNEILPKQILSQLILPSIPIQSMTHMASLCRFSNSYRWESFAGIIAKGGWGADVNEDWDIIMNLQWLLLFLTFMLAVVALQSAEDWLFKSFDTWTHGENHREWWRWSNTKR